MNKQLLIYEKAVPVSSQRHRDWSVKTGEDYSFARHVNAVPLTAVEFPQAAAEYAIVFVGTEEAVMPSVIIGARKQENLYLTPTGSWQAKYVPAFIRRYPFVFSSSNDGKAFTLCIDEEYQGCNQNGLGERLFDTEGNRTQYLESVLGFIQEYQAQFQRTQAFCKKIKNLDLIEPMQAQLTSGGGQQMRWSGFMAVSRDKLKKLSGDQLADLAKTDELELLYLQLHSMKNFRMMVERAIPSASAPSDNQAVGTTGKEKVEAQESVLPEP